MDTLISKMDLITNISIGITLLIFLCFSVMHGIKRGLTVTLIRVPFVVVSFFLAYLILMLLNNTLIGVATRLIESNTDLSGSLVETLTVFLVALIRVVSFDIVFFIVDKLLYIIFAIIKGKIRGRGQNIKTLSVGSKIGGVVVSMITAFALFIIYMSPSVGLMSSAGSVLNVAQKLSNMQTTTEQTEQTQSSDDESMEQMKELFNEFNDSFAAKTVMLCGGEYVYTYISTVKYAVKTENGTEIQETSLRQIVKSLESLTNTATGLVDVVNKIEAGTFDFSSTEDVKSVFDSIDKNSVELVASFKDVLVDGMTDGEGGGTISEQDIKVINAVVDVASTYLESVIENRDSDPEAYAKDIQAVCSTLELAMDTEAVTQMSQEKAQEVVDNILASDSLINALTESDSIKTVVNEVVGADTIEQYKDDIKEVLNSAKTAENESNLQKLADLFGIDLNEATAD